MRTCEKCGAEFATDVNFCTKCGKKFDNYSTKVMSDTKQMERNDIWKILDKCYVVDFLKNVFRGSNIPVLIYLALNVLLISMVAIYISDSNAMVGILYGIVLYAISLTIALSPLGEWILRFQTRCRKLNHFNDADRIVKLYEEVCENAKRRGQKVPKDVKLYMNEDEIPNAFATGRKTICITAGMTRLSDGEIKATLAHELGHLCHHDTDLILVISVGNMIISAIILGIRIICEMIHLMIQIGLLFLGGREGLVGSILTFVYKMLFDFCVLGFMWIWTKLGILLVMKSSRENEFEADGFAANLGYREELCVLLENIPGENEKKKGLFANLSSSHPDTKKRVARLRQIK